MVPAAPTHGVRRPGAWCPPLRRTVYAGLTHGVCRSDARCTRARAQYTPSGARCECQRPLKFPSGWPGGSGCARPWFTVRAGGFAVRALLRVVLLGLSPDGLKAINPTVRLI